MNTIKFYSTITLLVSISFVLALAATETGHGEEVLRGWFTVASMVVGGIALVLAARRIFEE